MTAADAPPEGGAWLPASSPEWMPMSIAADPTISPALRGTLDRRIGRALRGSYGAGTALRIAVREAAEELVAAGASLETARRMLERMVLEHPMRHAYDRVSIVTGGRSSEALARQVAEWTERPDAGVEPRARRGEGSTRRRHVVSR